MEKSLTTQITESIERTFSWNGRNLSDRIIVFPIGDVGIQVINILEKIYQLKPAYMIDNHKCQYNSGIHNEEFLKEINTEEYLLILASTSFEKYIQLRQIAYKYFSKDNIIEFEEMLNIMKREPLKFYPTRIGRYSYGPICRDHELIASIGSFCSISVGCDVVVNHEMRYITTHPMIFDGVNLDGMDIGFDYFRDSPFYFPGVQPKPIVKRWSRVTIGNDVWLGRNVIITNYAKIGNGVIAAAGAVITKDVPDYAIVAGVPAKIIKYRYTPDQIEALNKIAWWDWTDDEIRERFDDFYLPIEEFIKKYNR